MITTARIEPAPRRVAHKLDATETDIAYGALEPPKQLSPNAKPAQFSPDHKDLQDGPPAFARVPGTHACHLAAMEEDYRKIRMTFQAVRDGLRRVGPELVVDQIQCTSIRASHPHWYGRASLL